MIELTIAAAESPDPVLDLLLLADPQEALVREYVADGKLYTATWDNLTVGVFVLLPIDDDLWELKNIAVSPEWQGKGVGKRLLQEAIAAAKELGAKSLEAGTGNSSLDQLAYYQKAGFRMDRIAKNFFTLNYDEPIFENGIQCRDMVFLKLNLEG
ncbi:MAG: GNAT family N-acetyltransferase [Kordiimonadaceae bacterium]|nr:GNAT family N-acetyltransferase [Kordiimonadaceae bacterium]